MKLLLPLGCWPVRISLRFGSIWLSTPLALYTLYCTVLHRCGHRLGNSILLFSLQFPVSSFFSLHIHRSKGTAVQSSAAAAAV